MLIEHQRGESICTLRLELEAGDDGTFDPMPLPPFDGFWLTVKVLPGEPAPSDGFDVRVLTGAYDGLEGCGESCSGHQVTMRIVRYSGLDLHPAVAGSEVLTLDITGNRIPRARVALELRYGMGIELEDLLMGER